MQHHAAIELRETFVDVVGGDLEGGHGRHSTQSTPFVRHA
jgi:hypothetical protein